MVESKLKLISSKKLSAEENVKLSLSTIKKNKVINAILHVNENSLKDARLVDKKIKAGKAGRLAGLTVVVKTNISVKNLPVTCASKTLENYTGTFDADVITKIKNEDGIIVAMANCDEFACGSSGESSAFGPTQNPAAPGRIPGGSSSGSAAAVAAGMCDLALGSDTGGSVRNPASHCGIVGIKPSYGRVSRYGLVDMAMSLEGIGTFSKDVSSGALLMEVISGMSPNDAITRDVKVDNYSSAKPRDFTVGLSDEFEKLCVDKRIYQKILDRVRASGVLVKKVSLKHVNLAVQTYYPIVYVEFFSATRKFDGRRYGKKIEDVCGEEVLRRIEGGKEISRAEYKGMYYRKALMAKQLIAEDFQKAFEKVDVIVSPTTPMLPHKIGKKITDPRVMYAYDAFTIPANLAGICAGVVPAGKIDDIPVGLQLLAPAFMESKLIGAMKKFEAIP